MNWNPFTRITALEHQVQELQRALQPNDEEKIVRRRERQRAYYASQKAKEKQREYNRTYRERKKAEKLAAGGTA